MGFGVVFGTQFSFDKPFVYLPEGDAQRLLVINVRHEGPYVV